MQPQHVIIPLVGGVDEGTDDKNLPVDKLSVCRNMISDKIGGLVKRNGFRTVNPTLVDGGNISNIRALFSTDTEICAITDRTLYSFNELQGKWRNAGSVSSIGGRQNIIARDHKSYNQADIAVLNGCVVYGLQYEYYTDWEEISANWVNGIAIRITTEDKQELIPLFSLIEDSGTDGYHAVRCVSASGHGKIYILYVDGFGPGNINIASYIPTFPNNTPTISGVLINDLYRDSADLNNRRYDACELSNGNFALAYINNSQDIVVKSYNQSLVADTVTITGTYLYVAMAQNSTKVFIIASDGNQVETWAITKSSWTVTSGPTVVDTENSVDTLGIAASESDVTLIWSNEDLARRVLCNTSAVAITGVATLNNCSWRSKPQYITSGTYTTKIADCAIDQNCTVDVIGDGATVGSCGFIADLSSTPAMNFNMIHNFGQSYVSRGLNRLRLGSCNNFVTFSDGTVHTPTIILLNALWGFSDRYGIDEIVVDILPSITACKVSNGASVISGGYLAWYAGTRSHELGFLHSPKLVSQQDELIGAGLANGTYLHIGLFEQYDDSGNWHRSAPGKYTSTEVTGTNNTVAIEALSYSPTYRTTCNMQIFRADDDGTFKRITEPVHPVINDKTELVLPVFNDVGQAEADVLYTQAEELAPFITEGCSIVKVINNRLWIAGSIRGERVIYSKSLYRGTVSQPIAPELNDSLVFTTPDAQRVTGIGELNGDVIIFTRSNIYIVSGDGPDDAGKNNTFSGLIEIPSDFGCIEPRSVISYPEGLFFQSVRGIYHIDRNRNISFLGAPVKETLKQYPVITSAIIVPKHNHIRFTCTNTDGDEGVILIFDYFMARWLGFWEINGYTPFSGACLHGDDYYVSTYAGAVLKETDETWADLTNEYIVQYVETSWIQFATQSGWGRLWFITPALEEFAESLDYNLFLSLKVDFDENVHAAYPRQWTPVQIDAMPKIQIQDFVTPQEGQAWKIAIYDGEAGGEQSGGRGFRISNIRLDYGVENGPVRVGYVQRS